MTRSRDPVEEAIHRRKPTAEEQVAGLGLFIEPKPTMHLPGAGQLARMEARDKTDAEGDRARVLECLRQHPAGLTRRQIADELEMPINTVNARVAELCSPHRQSPTLAYTDGHRERVIEENGKPRPIKESIVFAREGISRG